MDDEQQRTAAPSETGPSETGAEPGPEGATEASAESSSPGSSSPGSSSPGSSGRASSGAVPERAVPDAVVHANTVTLCGRISRPAEERTLPSGDVIVTFRLVVERPPQTRRTRAPGRTPTVDTIDVVTWTRRPQRVARSLVPGDVVAVDGSLRRRFWRAAGAAVSRTEVEGWSVRRVARAAVSR